MLKLGMVALVATLPLVLAADEVDVELEYEIEVVEPCIEYFVEEAMAGASETYDDFRRGIEHDPELELVIIGRLRSEIRKGMHLYFKRLRRDWRVANYMPRRERTLLYVKKLVQCNNDAVEWAQASPEAS